MSEVDAIIRKKTRLCFLLALAIGALLASCARSGSPQVLWSFDVQEENAHVELTVNGKSFVERIWVAGRLAKIAVGDAKFERYPEDPLRSLASSVKKKVIYASSVPSLAEAAAELHCGAMVPMLSWDDELKRSASERLFIKHAAKYRTCIVQSNKHGSGWRKGFFIVRSDLDGITVISIP